MKVKGIGYDTGTEYRAGILSRENLDINTMRKEIQMIKSQLNCNAVRIFGGKLDRMIKCSKIALENNLEVWFSPKFINRTKEETVKLVESCAKEVEKLRKANPKVVFIVGNELTIDTKGFFEGEKLGHRIEQLKLRKGDIGKLNDSLNLFLKTIVSIVRNSFKGEITYASGPWEKVDWSIFDIVGVNKYLAKWNKDTYVKELKWLKDIGKPIAITEFGCGSYIGAADRGPNSYEIINWKRREIEGDYPRDEDEQANYILYLLKLFQRERIFGTFIHTFLEPGYVYLDNPKKDLDKASFNVVRFYPDGHIEPKKSFIVISDFYKNN